MNNIIDYLDELFPNPRCELNYNKDYELLLAVMLSAQTTDKRVNIVTPHLFKEYPTLTHLANASYENVYRLIESLGLAKRKAEYLIKFAKTVLIDFNGVVPNSLDELMSLSGVGYKTASVVLVEGFKIPAFPVDTHISRISKRIGLVKESLDPTEISISLMKLYDKSLYHKLHHQMIYLGRYTCKSQKPNCDECLMKDFCKYYKSKVK